MPKFRIYKGSILLELLFDATLLLLFSVQAFIAGCLLAYGHIPIPKDWVNTQLAKIESHDLRIEAEGFRLKLNGDFELTGPKVHSDKIRQPILIADGAVLKYQLWNDGAFQFKIESFLLSNGTLFLPAVYAPDGIRTPILERIAFHLEPTESLIRVDSFAARHEDIRLRGAIEWPLKPFTKSPQALDPLGRFFQTTSKALQEKRRFSPFKNPTLTFKLSVLEDQSVRIASQLSSNEFEHAEAQGTNFWLSADILLKNSQLISESPFSMRVDTISVPRFGVEAQSLSAQVAKEDWQDLLNGEWPDFKISAHKLSTQHIELTSPELTIHPHNFPVVGFFGATSGFKGAVAFAGEIDTAKKNGRIQAQGNVDLTQLIPESTIQKMPPLVFESAPYYDLTLNLGDGFSLDQVRFDCKTSNVSAGDIAIDYLHVRGSFGQGFFALEDVSAQRGKQWLDMKLSLNSESKDYKITLLGTNVRASEYNALLPRWWGSIFKDFVFEHNYNGYGDFIIYGNTLRRTSDLFFGHAQASNVRYKDVATQSADLIVRGRGRYVELHGLDVTSSNGWAKGNISFTSRRDEVRAPVSIRYDFKSKMPLLAAQKIFGGTVSEIIKSFTVKQAPDVDLQGVNFNKAYSEYTGCSTFHLKANSPEEITFKNIPLDHLSFTLNKQDSTTYLRDVKFGYADGIGTASIDILTPPEQTSELLFYISLFDADETQAIRDLPHLDHIEGDLENYESTAISRSGREEGRLNINLHARGPIDDLYQYNGYGDFTIQDKKLGSIQLLGPLSILLKNTRFSFTSFNLHRMTAAFRIADNDILFDPLRIDGPQTRITSGGKMKIKDQALSMKVKVNLFGNVGDPESTIRKVGNILTNPLPNLLEFDLTGTVKNQKWRSAYDPRNLLPTF